MIRDETAIANLLYAYAERIDSGDLAGAAQLFAHAQIKVGDRLVDAQDMLSMWQRASDLPQHLYRHATSRSGTVTSGDLWPVSR